MCLCGHSSAEERLVHWTDGTHCYYDESEGRSSIKWQLVYCSWANTSPFQTEVTGRWQRVVSETRPLAVHSRELGDRSVSVVVSQSCELLAFSTLQFANIYAIIRTRRDRGNIRKLHTLCRQFKKKYSYFDITMTVLHNVGTSTDDRAIVRSGIVSVAASYPAGFFKATSMIGGSRGNCFATCRLPL